MDTKANFSERTKVVLAESIKDLMKTTPLDKITIKEIVENCGTTRQTFYRYFKDKYDLVNWYFDRIVQKTIRKMGAGLTHREGLVKKFTYMTEDKAFFISALSSSDCNNLMKYDYDCIVEFYKTAARANGTVDDRILFLIEFYCHGSMDMTEAWVLGGMKLSPEDMADKLLACVPAELEPYLHKLRVE